MAPRYISRNRGRVIVTSLYSYVYSKNLIKLEISNFRRALRMIAVFIYYKKMSTS